MSNNLTRIFRITSAQVGQPVYVDEALPDLSRLFDLEVAHREWQRDRPTPRFHYVVRPGLIIQVMEDK